MKTQCTLAEVVLVVILLLPISGSRAEDEQLAAEAKAFAAIEENLPKISAGQFNPSESDLETRRKGSAEVIQAARQFLTNYPDSKRIEDAQSLIVAALYKGALAGSTNSAWELQNYARTWPTDGRVSVDLKERVCVRNYMAQWGLKNGQVDINEAKTEGRHIWFEGLFAAADAVDEKENIFKKLLLLARSGSSMNSEQTRLMAQRIRNHPGASAWVKMQTEEILSGVPPYAVGKPVEIKFTAIDGRRVDLADLKGKVVFVDFWATDCPPCVAEFPTLKATYDKFHDNGLEIIGISLDDDKNALDRVLKKLDIQWPQYFDGKGWNNEISFPFGIGAIPTVWVIDKKGILRSAKPKVEEGVLASVFLELAGE